MTLYLAEGKTGRVMQNERQIEGKELGTETALEDLLLQTLQLRCHQPNNALRLHQQPLKYLVSPSFCGLSGSFLAFMAQCRF